MMTENHHIVRTLFFICYLTIFSCTYQPVKNNIVMNDINSNTAYELTKNFAATPKKLYNAFTDQTTLMKVWGVSGITIDAKPGGKALAKLKYNNENWDFTITYKEVVPNEKLMWIVHFDRFPTKETRTTLL